MKAVWIHEEKDVLLHVADLRVKWVRMYFEAEG
jgi:hypothetical protein